MSEWYFVNKQYVIKCSCCEEILEEADIGWKAMKKHARDCGWKLGKKPLCRRCQFKEHEKEGKE